MPTVETLTTNAIAQAFLAEFENQAPITRRFLERLPEDKLTWKPHAKSMTAGQLAYHLAAVPAAVLKLASTNPGLVPDFGSFSQPTTRKEILNTFDETIVTVHEVLSSFDDAAMNETWRLIAGGREALAVPRFAFIRNAMLSHWYQHRGQFSVYLRMFDVPVPASFGPSADEPPLFMQQGLKG